MARQQILRCDVCRKPCKKITAKLLYVPWQEDKRPRFSHGNYTYHADVGECCAGEDTAHGRKILKLLNFRPRQTKEEYHSRGKKAS
jgi:hypothetical protein